METEHKYRELQRSIKLLGNVIQFENITDETRGLSQVITEYSRALDILDDSGALIKYCDPKLPVHERLAQEAGCVPEI